MITLMYCTGEVLGFESLVYVVFEFVHVLIDTSKFRMTVKSSVNDILYYVILYMQMTDDQVRDTCKREKKNNLIKKD